VSRHAFQTRLHDVLEKKTNEFSCPPVRAIDDALRTNAEEEVMFNSFCVELFAHPKIHEALEQERENE
jgi:hypothetical protein